MQWAQQLLNNTILDMPLALNFLEATDLTSNYIILIFNIIFSVMFPLQVLKSTHISILMQGLSPHMNMEKFMSWMMAEKLILI